MNRIRPLLLSLFALALALPSSALAAKTRHLPSRVVRGQTLNVDHALRTAGLTVNERFFGGSSKGGMGANTGNQNVQLTLRTAGKTFVAEAKGRHQRSNRKEARKRLETQLLEFLRGGGVLSPPKKEAAPPKRPNRKKGKARWKDTGRSHAPQ